MGVLRDALATAIERWIRTRNPPSSSTVLGQKHIFIIPNRYGLGLLLLVLLLFFMGTNYQNNLVLALAFWLLSVFILSILLTYYNLCGVVLKAGHSEPGTVGTPVRHWVSLHSPRERYGVLVAAQVTVPDRSHMDTPAPVHWLENLAAGSTETLAITSVYHRRGQYGPPRVRLETRFPFGWITAWVYWRPAQTVLIWPQALDHGVRRQASDTHGSRQPNATMREDELDGMRAYSPGDPLRRVFWRQYARSGTLQVKTPPASAPEDTHQFDLEQVRHLPLEHGLEQLTYWLTDCEARRQPWSLRLGEFFLPTGQGPAQRTAGLNALAAYPASGTDTGEGA